MVQIISPVAQYSITENNTDESAKNTERSFGFDDIKAAGFERYILVKGAHMSSIEQKLIDYSALTAQNDPYYYHFKIGKMGDWMVIKIPDDFVSHYEYHNLTYWFLGYPPKDQNYADQSVALAIKSKGAYLLYNDYTLRNELQCEDNLFGVFQNNERFLLSVPMDEFKTTNNKQVKTFSGFLSENKINLELIRSGNIHMDELIVRFNTKK